MGHVLLDVSLPYSDQRLMINPTAAEVTVWSDQVFDSRVIFNDVYFFQVGDLTADFQTAAFKVLPSDTSLIQQPSSEDDTLMLKMKKLMERIEALVSLKMTVPRVHNGDLYEESLSKKSATHLFDSRSGTFKAFDELGISTNDFKEKKIGQLMQVVAGAEGAAPTGTYESTGQTGYFQSIEKNTKVKFKRNTYYVSNGSTYIPFESIIDPNVRKVLSKVNRIDRQKIFESYIDQGSIYQRKRLFKKHELQDTTNPKSFYYPPMPPKLISGNITSADPEFKMLVERTYLMGMFPNYETARAKIEEKMAFPNELEAIWQQTCFIRVDYDPFAGDNAKGFLDSMLGFASNDISIDISSYSVVIQQEAFLRYTTKVRELMNQLVAYFELGQGYMGLVFLESLEMTDMVDVNGVIADYNKRSGKFLKSMNKFQDKQVNAVKTMCDQLFNFVSSTNGLEAARVDMIIDTFPKIFDFGEDTSAVSYLANFLAGVLGSLADEATNVISTLKSIRKAQFSQKRAQIDQTNALAMANYSMAITNGWNRAKPFRDNRYNNFNQLGGINFWDAQVAQDGSGRVDQGYYNSRQADITKNLNEDGAYHLSFGKVVHDALKKDMGRSVYNSVGKLNKNDIFNEIKFFADKELRAGSKLDKNINTGFEALKYTGFWETTESDKTGFGEINAPGYFFSGAGFDLYPEKASSITSEAMMGDKPNEVSPEQQLIDQNEKVRQKKVEYNALKTTINSDAFSRKSDKEKAPIYKNMLTIQKELLEATGDYEDLENLDDVTVKEATITTLEEAQDSPPTSDQLASLVTNQENRYTQLKTHGKTDEIEAKTPEEMQEIIDERKKADADIASQDNASSPDAGPPSSNPSNIMYTDYNVYKSTRIRQYMTNFQNFLRISFSIQNRIMNRKRDVAQSLSGKRGSNAVSQMNQSATTALNNELEQQTQMVNQMMQFSQSLLSNINSLSTARAEVCKNFTKTSLRLSEKTAREAMDAIATSSAASMASVTTIIGLEQNYWEYGLKTAGAQIINSTFKGLELRLHDTWFPEEKETFRPAILQFQKGHMFTERNAKAQFKEPKLQEDRINLGRTDQSGVGILNYKDIAFKMRKLMTNRIVADRVNYLPIQEKKFRENFDRDEFHMPLVGYNKDKTSTNPFPETKEKNFESYIINTSTDDQQITGFHQDKLHLFAKEPDSTKSQNNIRLQMLILRAYFDAIENNLQKMFGGGKIGAFGEFDNMLNAVFGFEQQLHGAYQQEIGLLNDSIGTNITKKRAISDAQYELDFDIFKTIASLSSFIPTYPAGPIANAAAQSAVDVADITRKFGWGAYSDMKVRFRKDSDEFSHEDLEKDEYEEMFGRIDAENRHQTNSQFSGENKRYSPAHDYGNLFEEEEVGSGNYKHDEIDVYAKAFREVDESFVEAADTASDESRTSQFLFDLRTKAWDIIDEYEKDIFHDFMHKATNHPFKPQSAFEYRASALGDVTRFREKMNSLFMMRVLYATIERVLYQSKQQQLQKMFQVSSAAQIMSNLMQVSDSHNSLYLSSIDTLVEEYQARYNNFNTHYSTVISLAQESSMLAVKNIALYVLMRDPQTGTADDGTEFDNVDRNLKEQDVFTH